MIGIGYRFNECPSCGFDSQQHENLLKELYDANCLVCNLVEKNCLKIKCPDCDTEVYFKNEGIGVCSNLSCEKVFQPTDLAEALHAVRSCDDTWEIGNCSDCDGYHTVAKIKDESYFCVMCFNVFPSMQSCLYCDELNTGDMSDTHWHGCNFCSGYADHIKDD